MRPSERADPPSQIQCPQGDFLAAHPIHNRLVAGSQVNPRLPSFIGAAEAEKKTAILCTIVESCRRRGVDPLAYLHDVLTRLPRSTNHTVHELTPENWAKARSASKKRYAAAA
ncbi:MAG: transposase domain-containing protein [Chthoniobacterales bacterium]|nr:transposase domain-containing protein [Chthoniobacterales bacterium]